MVDSMKATVYGMVACTNERRCCLLTTIWTWNRWNQEYLKCGRILRNLPLAEPSYEDTHDFDWWGQLARLYV